MPKGEFTIFDDPVVNVIKSKIPAAAAEINTDNNENSLRSTKNNLLT